MHFISLLHPLLVLALAGEGTPVNAVNARSSAVTGKAIYFITNDEVNSVAALPIANDGTLSQGTVTKTGGAGSVAVDADGQPATPDALVGQSALTIAGNVRTNPIQNEAHSAFPVSPRRSAGMFC
ncbi:hypothetical protein IMZ48_00020 [Candidatus Bathyarchaeota archaeon]|nr:hypothetical protein [Candidatus Bathyarchaeota archaeon]